MQVYSIYGACRWVFRLLGAPYQRHNQSSCYIHRGSSSGTYLILEDGQEFNPTLSAKTVAGFTSIESNDKGSSVFNVTP